MEPIRASVRHVSSEGGDFDVLTISGYNVMATLCTSEHGHTEFTLFTVVRASIENIRKVCDDWLLQDFLKGER